MQESGSVIEQFAHLEAQSTQAPPFKALGAAHDIQSVLALPLQVKQVEWQLLQPFMELT